MLADLSNQERTENGPYKGVTFCYIVSLRTYEPRVNQE